MSVTYDYELLKATQLYQPSTNNPDLDFSTQKWHEAIDKLLAHHYSFLAETYTENSYVFRGMSSGLLNALQTERFSHFEGSNELCLVEQVMNVYFLTHELSDALTVARLFEKEANDAALLVIPSEVFIQAQEKAAAAMLAIGDFGFVFRYPFLASAIGLTDCAYIIHQRNTSLSKDLVSQHCDKLISVNELDRKNSEEEIKSLLKRKNITAASVEKTQDFPTRNI